jgi:hypothetical protein
MRTASQIAARARRRKEKRDKEWEENRARRESIQAAEAQQRSNRIWSDQYRQLCDELPAAIRYGTLVAFKAKQGPTSDYPLTRLLQLLREKLVMFSTSHQNLITRDPVEYFEKYFRFLLRVDPSVQTDIDACIACQETYKAAFAKWESDRAYKGMMEDAIAEGGARWSDSDSDY